MPVLNVDNLAQCLHSNWVAKGSTDKSGDNASHNLDDSLTSLNWLQNLNVMKIGGTNLGDADDSCDQTRKRSPEVSGGVDVISRGNREKVDYKRDPFVKPSYSYATLICMAMRDTNKKKLTLSAIYNWITKNFMYYRMADPSWQNSVRHNLSLNKCFEKVPRRKDEPGKGGFWRINPEFGASLENGTFRKRRIPRDSLAAMNTKRFKGVGVDLYGKDYEGADDDVDEEENLGVGLIHFGNDAQDLNDNDYNNNNDDDDDEINWNALLKQDIAVNGTRVKTEQLIDVTDNLDGPLVALSHPPLDASTQEISLDDLLANDVFGSQQICGSPLDLTIMGTSIPPPDWWFDNISTNESHGSFRTTNLSSPVHESHFLRCERDVYDDIASAFDVDDLFDIENLPSPRIV